MNTLYLMDSLISVLVILGATLRCNLNPLIGGNSGTVPLHFTLELEGLRNEGSLSG